MKPAEFAAQHEPADGAVLAANTAQEWRLFVRDDRNAADWDYPDDHRWFDAYDPGAGPNTLTHWLSDAGAVFSLGAKLADFT